MQNVFDNIKTIAIVGLSDDTKRPSYEVASYLQEKGFTIIPVNPNIETVLGAKSYPDLLSIPEEIKIDVADIFRKSELVLPHVKEALKRGDIKTIWLQEGVENKEAEDLARSNGLNVVSNFCIMKTHKTLA